MTIGTTIKLEIATSSTSTIQTTVNYVDSATDMTTYTPITLTANEITTATTTDLVASPGTGLRTVNEIGIRNTGTAANAITIKSDASATERTIYVATLQPGQGVQYTPTVGWKKFASTGEEIVTSSTNNGSIINAKSFSVTKVGSTAEAAGLFHFLGFATGNPGAWAVGTPGLNGRATDGTQAADAGCVPIKNPSTGSNYLTSLLASLTTASTPMFIDLLWTNSGLAVTTTTAQAITPVALPARDTDGTTNGDGVIAGILVATATTNAGAVTNTTMSYTNSLGVAGRTATMASFPITAVAGTLIPFQLQAGDVGVRSVQSVTLGTSYGAGAISLVLYRFIAGTPQLIANAGAMIPPQIDKVNIRLYNGVCLLPCYFTTATTATTMSAWLNVEEK